MIDNPKIYVACLAAYNSAVLHGVWIDATDDIADIYKQILGMIKASPVEDAEEFAIHDYEGFGSFGISEYEGIESIHEKALFIEEHGELGISVLNHWCGDIDEARKAMEEGYHSEYESLANYAQMLTEDTTDIPDEIEDYIDYERMALDMEMNSDLYTIETGYQQVHVFWNC